MTECHWWPLEYICVGRDQKKGLVQKLTLFVRKNEYTDSKYETTTANADLLAREHHAQDETLEKTDIYLFTMVVYHGYKSLYHKL